MALRQIFVATPALEKLTRATGGEYGRVAGAIDMSGPMWRLSLQPLQEKSRYVREAAVELSAEPGFQAQREPAASIA